MSNTSTFRSREWTALKLHAKAVRAAVEKRPRKTGDGFDREHWRASFTLWNERGTPIATRYEQPSIHSKRKRKGPPAPWRYFDKQRAA